LQRTLSQSKPLTKPSSFHWLMKSTQIYAKLIHSHRNSKSNLQKFKKSKTGCLLSQVQEQLWWLNHLLMSLSLRLLKRQNHTLATRTGIKLDKILTKSLKTRSRRVMPLWMGCSSRYMREQMKIQEEPWWRVIKLLEALFYQLTGVKFTIKTTRARIDQVHQMARCGLTMLRRLKLQKGDKSECF